MPSLKETPPEVAAKGCTTFIEPSVQKGRNRPTVMLIHPEYRDLIFNSSLISEIEEIAHSPITWMSPADTMDSDALEKAEVIYCSWGTPLIDERFLKKTPNLKAIFYAAGSPQYFLTPHIFERGIVVSSAQAANAIPVIEYSLAVILLSLKRVWLSMRETHRNRSWIKPERTVAGAYRSTVGLVSLGLIGLGVAKALSHHDLNVLAYDPFVSTEQASQHGVKLVSLPHLFSESDVVSIHSPLNPSTTGMIGHDLLSLMKPRATLVNTSRGAVIRQSDLCDILRQRPDLSAVLDVTDPEPPEFDSPIWDLPNVFLTPHSSGSLGAECLRMARFMIDEFRRYSRGIPLLHQVIPQSPNSTCLG